MTNSPHSPTAFLFYQTLLGFYPPQHRKEYGEEMRLLFQDLYSEELDRNKEIGIGFWLRLTGDVLINTFSEHVSLLKRIGIKEYLSEIYNINVYFWFGFILLFPFLSVISLDTLNVILTGHHEWLQGLYKSALWSPPVVITLALIFPILASIATMIGIVRAYKNEHHRVVSFSFLVRHFPSVLVFLGSLLAITILFGHDLIPCIVDQTFSNGLLNIGNTISYCGKHS